MDPREMTKVEGLRQEFPRLFANTHPYNVGCGDGWYPIIRAACVAMIMCSDDDKAPEIVQIKEKFGGLRIYVDNSNEAIRAIVDAAETKAEETCEYCGAPGKARGGGWVKTLCDDCNKVRQR